MAYTVHDPSTGMKCAEFKTLDEALDHAYTFLPLDVEGQPLKAKRPKPTHVTVQEWDESYEPLRQWTVAGRMPEPADS